MGVFLEPPFWAHEREFALEPRVGVSVATPPVGEPILLAEAKLYAKIQTTEEDAIAPRWLSAARMKVERDTGVRFLTQTIDVSLDAFPWNALWFTFPVWPVQSVTSVSSYDTAGVQQVLGSGNYILDKTSLPPRLGLTDAGSWPTDVRYFQHGVIRIVAGWATAADIPADLLMAVHQIFNWLAMNREPSRFERDSYRELIQPYVLEGLA